jgi:hypothetical protein
MQGKFEEERLQKPKNIKLPKHWAQISYTEQHRYAVSVTRK